MSCGATDVTSRGSRNGLWGQQGNTKWGGVQVRVKVVKVGECEQEGVFLCQSHTRARTHTCVCAPFGVVAFLGRRFGFATVPFST